jgi:hypothetical protein
MFHLRKIDVCKFGERESFVEKRFKLESFE